MMRHPEGRGATLHCQHCGRDLPLVFHHVFEAQYGGKRYDYQFLCEECHNKLHRGKRIPEYVAMVVSSPTEKAIKLTIRMRKHKAYAVCEVPQEPITEEVINKVTSQVADVCLFHGLDPLFWGRPTRLPKRFIYVDGKLLIDLPDLEQLPLLED